MDPVTIAYMGAQVAKGAADFYKNRKQKQAAKNLPKMQDDTALQQYTNLVRQYATEGPLAPSQQANMSRQIAAQSQPGFQMARQNIQQRAAASGLEDSAVVGQQEGAVDLARANTLANIARRIATRNEDLRLGYVSEQGRLASNAYANRLALAQAQIPFQGQGAATIGQTALDVAGTYKDVKDKEGQDDLAVLLKLLGTDS